MDPDERSLRISGFTLIELLVVIAIVAVLAALAFPAYRAVARKSGTTQCVSNLRQFGVAFQAFANDHDMRLPSADDTGGIQVQGPDYGKSFVASYFGANDLGALICPTAKTAYTRGATMHRMYGQNTGGEFDPLSDKTVEWRLTLISSTASKMFYTCMPEAAPGWSNPYFFWSGGQCSPLPYWHDDGVSHVLMLDWHVELFRRENHATIRKDQLVLVGS